MNQKLDSFDSTHHSDLRLLPVHCCSFARGELLTLIGRLPKWPLESSMMANNEIRFS